MASSLSESTIFTKDEGTEAPISMPGEELKFDSCVADDSQDEDNGLYLSDCRILFVGFHVTEMRKLVNMVRKGGGCRFMSFSEKVTHIVVGSPSENERKEIRQCAASTVVYVVRTVWLDDCDREKREIPVSQRYIVSDLLPLQSPVCSIKTVVTGNGMPLEKCGEGKRTTRMKNGSSVDRRSRNVFKGLLFCFSSYFPTDRRAEIVEWINQGGGAIVDQQSNQSVHFTIESHGLFRRPTDASQTTIVSCHWIRSCLEDGCMPDVSSNVIYSPLPCQVPLPRFEIYRFCISQYEKRERELIRNLCFVLGGKFTEKLSGKVTHLLCKFRSGPKYEAASKWGIESVTSDWILECIRKDAIVSMNPFRPKEVTVEDQEAGLCTMSQYYTQTAGMAFGDMSSQLPSQSQVSANLTTHIVDDRDDNLNEAKHSSASIKRLRLSNDDINRDLTPTVICEEVSATCKMDSVKASISKVVQEVSHDTDVATVIEDLLAQSNKIQDMKSLGRSGSDLSSFSPVHVVLDQTHEDSPSAIGISNHWLSKNKNQDDHCNTSEQDVEEVSYDGFCETQTESQVVGYEEDLSGIQMILERVRTRRGTT